MPGYTLPEGIIRQIFSDERSPVRFEHFCCDLLSEVSGYEILPTSRSWDLGRDGRSVPSVGGKIGFLCCGLEEGFDAKAQADLKRLLDFAKPDAIFFCTAGEKSEKYLHDIEVEIANVATGITNSALGGYQLLALVQRYSDAFERRYAAELIELRGFLAANEDPTHDAQIEGMQVALTVQLGDNAQALRDEFLQSLILSALADGMVKSVKAIAKSSSDSLRLPRLMNTSYFFDLTDRLANDGLILLANDAGYEITQAGRTALEKMRANSVQELARGEKAVREAIDKLLGDHIDDESFRHLWRRFTDTLANLFLSHGLSIIRTIGSLTRDDDKHRPSRPFSDLLTHLSDAIKTTGVGGARVDEVAQAVVDLFSERDSVAFEWLSELAMKYVGLCSLGLEPNAQQEISGRLKEIDLIIDTDVVLSLLSEGERPHKVVQAVLEGWSRIGGAIVVCPPVLEEAAYHAWISEL